MSCRAVVSLFGLLILLMACTSTPEPPFPVVHPEPTRIRVGPPIDLPIEEVPFVSDLAEGEAIAAVQSALSLRIAVHGNCLSVANIEVTTFTEEYEGDGIWKVSGEQGTIYWRYYERTGSVSAGEGLANTFDGC